MAVTFVLECLLWGFLICQSFQYNWSLFTIARSTQFRISGQNFFRKCSHFRSLRAIVSIKSVFKNLFNVYDEAFAEYN